MGSGVPQATANIRTLVREWPRILGHLQKGAALEWVTVSQFSVAGPCRGILCMIGGSTSGSGRRIRSSRQLRPTVGTPSFYPPTPVPQPSEIIASRGRRVLRRLPEACGLLLRGLPLYTFYKEVNLLATTTTTYK